MHINGFFAALDFFFGAEPEPVALGGGGDGLPPIGWKAAENMTLFKEEATWTRSVV